MEKRLPWVQARTNSWTYSMYFDTADQNYVLARWAFRHGMYFDFYWLIAHALEKYLKAVLLLNGGSAKKYGHRILDLRRDVLRLDTRLHLAALTCPAAITDPSYWIAETEEHFFQRVANLGDPNNRYALHGFSMLNDDLYKADQVIYAVRRICRPFIVTVKTKPPRDLDYVDILNRTPSMWTVGHGLVEKLMHLDPTTAATVENEQAAVFRRFNYAFDPACADQWTSWGWSSQEPILADTYRILTQTNDGKEDGAAGALAWAIENTALNGKTEQLFQEAIDKARGTTDKEIKRRRLKRRLQRIWPDLKRLLSP